MYHVTEAMTRWIAPVLSFTADEVWENMPGKRDELGAFIAEWYDGLSPYANEQIDVSVWELFWPFAAGARLVLARPEGHRDPRYLAELIGSVTLAAGVLRVRARLGPGAAGGR